MTKPAERTITYVVYPPFYQPGDGYRIVKSLREAEAICRKLGFGIGSEVTREMSICNRKGRGHRFVPFRDLGKNGRRYDEFTFKGNQNG